MWGVISGVDETTWGSFGRGSLRKTPHWFWRVARSEHCWLGYYPWRLTPWVQSQVHTTPPPLLPSQVRIDIACHVRETPGCHTGKLRHILPPSEVNRWFLPHSYYCDEIPPHSGVISGRRHPGWDWKGVPFPRKSPPCRKRINITEVTCPADFVAHASLNTELTLHWFAAWPESLTLIGPHRSRPKNTQVQG